MKEKIVCVEWDDASYDNGYYYHDKAPSFTPIKTRSVGHLIKSSRKSITISQERFYDSDSKATDDRHISCIPRGMIRKVTYLREG